MSSWPPPPRFCFQPRGLSPPLSLNLSLPRYLCPVYLVQGMRETQEALLPPEGWAAIHALVKSTVPHEEGATPRDCERSSNTLKDEA